MAKRHRARRRHNPVPVLVANPRHGRRRRRHNPKRRRRHNPTHRARRRVLAIQHAPRHRRRRHNPVRHHRRRRRCNPFMGRGLCKHRRRHNPMRMQWGSIKSLIIIGAFGMAGIAVARQGKALYKKVAAAHVLGASPGKGRAILNEVLQAGTMGLVVYAGGEVLKHLKVSPVHALAFKVGGMAETVRHATGGVILQLKPGFNTAQWGLDGGSGYHSQLSPGARGMGDLEDNTSFEGMGDLEDVNSFDGHQDRGHPFAVMN